jgi:hypothetical protein
VPFALRVQTTRSSAKLVGGSDVGRRRDAIDGWNLTCYAAFAFLPGNHLHGNAARLESMRLPARPPSRDDSRDGARA